MMDILTLQCSVDGNDYMTVSNFNQGNEFVKICQYEADRQSTCVILNIKKQKELRDILDRSISEHEKFQANNEPA